MWVHRILSLLSLEPHRVRAIHTAHGSNSDQPNTLQPSVGLLKTTRKPRNRPHSLCDWLISWRQKAVQIPCRGIPGIKAGSEFGFNISHFPFVNYTTNGRGKLLIMRQQKWAAAESVRAVVRPGLNTLALLLTRKVLHRSRGWQQLFEQHFSWWYLVLYGCWIIVVLR